MADLVGVAAIVSAATSGVALIAGTFLKSRKDDDNDVINQMIRQKFLHDMGLSDPRKPQDDDPPTPATEIVYRAWIDLRVGWAVLMHRLSVMWL